MHYTLVFDTSEHPYRNFTFVLPGLIFVLVGAVMVFAPQLLEALFRKPLRQRYIFRWFFFIFAVIWTFAATSAMWRDASNAGQLLKSRKCQMVEGKVENFHPMPASGHDTERFDVKGVHFEYSDFIVSAGFNNAASHGGPIREGLPVRICYSDGEILRLEISQ